ncbi:hypothetical protein P7C70_g993, partial [Phenoliferia sp. Uapishka_3]
MLSSDARPESRPASIKSPERDDPELEESEATPMLMRRGHWLSRKTWVLHRIMRRIRLRRSNSYSGALIVNFVAFLLPAVYATLSKMWIANIDTSQVATTDAYTYASIVVECFNEGLPRAAWNTVANDSLYSKEQRLSLVRTLVIIQSAIGLILSLSFIGAADSFVGNFVPGPVQDISVRYVRISAFGSGLASTLETAVSLGTRALDHPEQVLPPFFKSRTTYSYSSSLNSIPLMISSVKVLLQIFLDLALISTVHVRGVHPSITIQAIIRLVCDLTGAFVGLGCFLYIARGSQLPSAAAAKPSLASLRVLAIPGIPTFIESAVRNAIYLYLVHNVILRGQNYATGLALFASCGIL